MCVTTVETGIHLMERKQKLGERSDTWNIGRQDCSTLSTSMRSILSHWTRDFGPGVTFADDPVQLSKDFMSNGKRRFLHVFHQSINHESIMSDVRGTSTAPRFRTGTTDENIQMMHGFGLQRVVIVQGRQKNMPLTYCVENTLNAIINFTDRVLFTDRYFQS